MDKTVKVYVLCPYCGLGGALSVVPDMAQVVCCDSESGGCGRYIGVDVRTQYDVTVYVMQEVMPSRTGKLDDE